MNTRHIISKAAVIFSVALLPIGCGSSDDVVSDPSAQVVSALESCPNSPPKVEVIPLGSNRYFMIQSVELAKPTSVVWPEVRDFEQFIQLLVPGVDLHFNWVQGNASIVPSTYELDVGGGLILREQVFFRSDLLHLIKYRTLNTPILGLEKYTAAVSLTPGTRSRTTLIYVRDFTAEPGTSVEDLTQELQAQLVGLQAHFASGCSP